MSKQRMSKKEAIEWIDYHMSQILNEGCERGDELYKALKMAKHALEKLDKEDDLCI